MFLELSSFKKPQAQKHEENCTKIKSLNTSEEKKNLKICHRKKNTRYFQRSKGKDNVRLAAESWKQEDSGGPSFTHWNKILSTQNSVFRENILKKWKANDFFCHIKGKRIHYYQTLTTKKKSYKTSFKQKKMIPNWNLYVHKEMENTTTPCVLNGVATSVLLSWITCAGGPSW